jgi:hypothetical protein
MNEGRSVRASGARKADHEREVTSIGIEGTFNSVACAARWLDS